MADRELLDRFDRHMVRIDEEIRLSREAAERHAAMSERHAAMFDDTREFIREMTLRIQRGTDALVAELADHRDASRASTQAVLALIDRLGPAPGSGPERG